MEMGDGREEAGCRRALGCAMSHPYGGKSAVQNQAGGPTGGPSEEAEHLLRHRPVGEANGWQIESRRPEQEGSERKARGGAWSGFLSRWASPSATGSCHRCL